jgi:hypothetical protein
MISNIVVASAQDYTSSRALTSGPKVPPSLPLCSNSNSNNSKINNNNCSNIGNDITSPSTDSTNDPQLQLYAVTRKPVKSESKLKYKLKKIEGIFKGRKDKHDIKEDRSEALIFISVLY